MDNFDNIDFSEKKQKRRFPLLLLILMGVLLGVIFSRFTAKYDISWIIQNFNTLKKAGEITKLINDNYFHDSKDEVLENGIYRGLVDSLGDPYSQYFTAEEWKEFNIQTTGKYAGIGARLSQSKDTMIVTVMEVYEDSPAAEAGIKKGDTIVSADGVLAISMDLSEFVQKLRGEENTTVDVVFSRNGTEHKATITRRLVISPSVYYNMLDEDTGYLQITQFEENTFNEFKSAISAMEKEGMKDIVYDIRSNPGGLVSSVTDILDEMLPEGTTVYMEDKYGNRNTFKSDEENQLNYPCIVLVDGASASSSEIFAGAIRDYEYGKLLGTKTFGKGIVQNTFMLSDGSAIKLTISEYFTPKGNNIHQKGIEPDIKLEYRFLGKEGEEYDQALDNQIQKALSILNGE